jgi:3-carboxy-cis,cis-muconate cycloisomerase
VSERLTVALAPTLGKSAAKELLGRIAGQAAAGEGTFEELLRAAPELADADLTDLLDPARYLGAADELVDRALARHRALPALPDPR